jgi:hypothetical protein
MPCSDGYSPQAEAASLRERLDNLTRMWCSQCGALEREGKLSILMPAVQQWWALHKAEDARREQQRQKQEDERRRFLQEAENRERAEYQRLRAKFEERK